jgi:hypothetical protein
VININTDKMQQVIQQAFDCVAGNRCWESAIVRAQQQLESNPYMYFDGEALLVLSESNEIYRANRACQCKAYANGHPCWHRAAARLIQRYNEKSHCNGLGERIN